MKGRRPIWVWARKSIADAAAMVASGWPSSSKGSRLSVPKCFFRLSAARSGSRIDSSSDRMTVLLRAVLTLPPPEGGGDSAVMSSRRIPPSVSTRISAGCRRSRWSMTLAAGISMAANSPVDASSHDSPARWPSTTHAAR